MTALEQAPYHVHSFWDADAAVWVATSEDVPGLVTEAETIEALSGKLRALIPELLRLNDVLSFKLYQNSIWSCIRMMWAVELDSPLAP
jgi:hypothetical protein